jgi:hypothetical protein
VNGDARCGSKPALLHKKMLEAFRTSENCAGLKEVLKLRVFPGEDLGIPCDAVAVRLLHCATTCLCGVKLNLNLKTTQKKKK